MDRLAGGRPTSPTPVSYTHLDVYKRQARTYIVREPLHRLATRLDPAQFIRVHRSTIIQLDQVAELQPLTNRDAMLRLQDGTPLRGSRTYIDALLTRLRDAGTPPR